MIRLGVFIGKPGSGKTTLIQATVPEMLHIDVFPFVKQHEKDGVIPEEKTILGYHDMYQHVRKELQENNEPIILELGTNHAERNVQELQLLAKEIPIVIFLCIAPIEICRSRIQGRGRPYDSVALELRLQRNFPDSHIPLFTQALLPFTMLDMERPLEENSGEVRKKLIPVSY